MKLLLQQLWRPNRRERRNLKVICFIFYFDQISVTQDVEELLSSYIAETEPMLSIVYRRYLGKDFCSSNMCGMKYRANLCKLME